MSIDIINELSTIAVYNTPTYSTVYTTVSPVLIESSIIIASRIVTCCSYTATNTKSPQIPTSIPDTTDSTGVPGEGEVI